MWRPAVLFVTVLTIPAWPADAQTIAIRAGHVVNPADGATTGPQTILVVDGIIQAVGSQIALPQGAEVIDLSRANVLPGLFDAHTHLCSTIRPQRDGGRFLPMTLYDSNAARAVEGVINARAVLEAGFTTVRDVGNEGNFACTAVRQAIDDKRIVGPTMVTAGRIIAPYGGQFQLQPDRRDLAEPEYFFADTRDEMLKAIRENIHYGAGVIKIVVDDQRYIYSVEDISFMKEEADRAGLRVAAHAWTAAGAHNAAAARVTSIEHLWAIQDQDLELGKRNGVTAVFTPLLDVETKLFGLPDTAHEQQIDRIRAALRIGIPLAFGSDAVQDIAGFDRGRLALERIDLLFEAGMTPAQLLKSMTTMAAQLLGVADKRGAIRPGMVADLVATPLNPLEDRQALKRVSFVMKGGLVVRNDAKP